MPLQSPKNRKLRTSNSVLHFANMTPIKQTKSGFLDGLVGIFRILGLIVEIGASILFPAAAPAIAIGGGLFQETLDIYTFATSRQGAKDITNFTLGALVNFIPTALVAKDFKASKSVLRIADKTESNGFRYVIKGIDPEYSTSLSKVGLNKGVDTISIARQKALIQKGILPRWTNKINKLDFEEALQYSFNSTIKGEKILSGYHGKAYYLKEGDTLFSNRDLSILRNEVRQISKGRRLNEQQIVKNMNRLSKSAKAALGMDIIVSRRAMFSSMGRERHFIDKLNSLSQLYIRHETNLLANTGKQMGVFEKGFKWFGSKWGRRVTQAGQLPNPNDMAREALNKPTGWLLNGVKIKNKDKKTIAEWKGLKNWSKNLGAKLEQKMPKVAKILKAPGKSRAVMKFNYIKEQLEKHGVVVNDTQFLMGWRVLDKSQLYSRVVFYFNPMTTSARTPGSLNYGGKPSFDKTINNKHLDALQASNSPGSMYLKGEGGYLPVALSPGGKRPVAMDITNELVQFALLADNLGPWIDPLRNILSLVSNTKNVITDLARGTYGAKWSNTLSNTFQRLYVNKITKIVGSTVGGIVSQEAGAHLSRLLKTSAQGFQHTKSKIVYVNGKKITKKYTKFSFNEKFRDGKTWHWQPLVKQGIPLTGKSAVLRRAPKQGAPRKRQKYTRYGTNIRRIPGIGTSFIK